MSTDPTPAFAAFDDQLDLTFTRTVAIPRALVWRAWTEPEHLMPWFCPRPWQTVECRIDLRPGGQFFTVMRSPEGEESRGDGCYLHVAHQECLIWTDALSPGYRPSGGGFMTGCIRLADAPGGGTVYTATAIHASSEIRKQHADMGFQDGWNTALDQLVAYVESM